MRVSLTALALGAIGTGCGATVSHRASARVHVYDDPRITVVSPTVEEQAQIADTKVTAHYGVDAVSGATQALTVDAVSAATRFSEVRQDAGLRGAHAFSPETELSGGYNLSREPDDLVHAPSLRLTQELFERMVRAAVGYQLVVESIGRTGDPLFREHALGHRVDVEWTQIATRSLTLTVLGTGTATECSAGIGCFANPYRYVGIARGAARIALPERHPDQRFTGAGALRLSWAFAGSSALQAGSRWAVDSWSVAAYTADAAVVTELFGDRLLARAEARATLQSRASFYDERYQSSGGELPAYRTADAELSGLRNARAQLFLDWAWGPVHIVGQVGRMWNYYPGFPALPTRHAWIAGGGLDASF